MTPRHKILATTAAAWLGLDPELPPAWRDDDDVGPDLRRVPLSFDTFSHGGELSVCVLDALLQESLAGSHRYRSTAHLG
ncbi:hypothetical protein CCO03_12135 [Comamonas serinivorans]|uniref:Uncharacterized protein n=1 Tax=Comamonas serinivorans TaxID=1082851 RepID=A0A1Y0ENY2_9BURK|nr:hypothetical protein [Comamonas serinivorans]ARU05333.1 hypothetical protein CCO03_12135 [Comamonas serinivorans]